MSARCWIGYHGTGCARSSAMIDTLSFKGSVRPFCGFCDRTLNLHVHSRPKELMRVTAFQKVMKKWLRGWTATLWTIQLFRSPNLPVALSAKAESIYCHLLVLGSSALQRQPFGCQHVPGNGIWAWLLTLICCIGSNYNNFPGQLLHLTGTVSLDIFPLRG